MTKTQNFAHQNMIDALRRKLVETLSHDYDFTKQRQSNGVFFYDFRCVYSSHNEVNYDNEPSAWVGVDTDGRLISGCWACGKRQFVYQSGEWQIAPTLHTLPRNDPHLRKVLVALGCAEVSINNNPAVAFPVVYNDGTQGFHYRIALEGKNKWQHQKGGKAKEAVFALHNKGLREGIKKRKFVVVTESPLDAAVLIAAGIPTVAVLGCNNAEALGCELHRETLLEALGDNGLIYVWQENDAPQFAQAVAQVLQRPVKVISPPDPDRKDAFRIWLSCGKDWNDFKQFVKDLIDDATDLQPQPPTPQQPPTGSNEVSKTAIPDQVFKRLDDITVQHTEWLVPDYLPIGVVTLLAGEGGHGKTTLISNLAAAILKGDKWLNKFSVPQGCVIWIATEGIDEIRNKLLGYGVTDDDPVLFVDLTAWEGYTPLRAAQSLPELLRLAKERLQANFGDIPIRLVALDCMRGFGFDEKQASRQKGDRLPTVREIYNPLTEFAQREGAAVIVTHHFRKLQPDERRRLYPKRKKGKEVAPEIDINLLRNLIAGTTDLVNAARHALVVVSDLEAGTALLVPVKSNRSQGLGLPIKYDWQADAPTFLNFVSEDETVIERAIGFLKRVLAEGAKSSSVVKELAEREGISNRTLWRAKARLGVCAFKRDGEWLWALSIKFSNFGTDTQKPQEKQALSSVPTTVPNENGFGTVGIVGSEASVPSVPNPKPIGTDIGTVKNPINTRVSGQVCQVCQTFPNSLPTDGSPQPSAPENSHNLLLQPENASNSENLRAGEDWRWDLMAAGAAILPDLLLPNSDERIYLNKLPAPENSHNLLPKQENANHSENLEDWRWGVLGEGVGILPDPEPPTQPDPPSTQSLQPPVLSEPICPQCGEPLDPEDDGLAACPSCGRVYIVSQPPDPSPTGGLPPQAQPTEPTTQTSLFSPEPQRQPDRMTERLEDGSIVLSWQGKSETVAPQDLSGWLPVEEIPEADLPAVETVSIPPVVVLDLETTALDPQEGKVLAAGVLLCVEDKEVETQIFCGENETEIVQQVFDYLEDLSRRLGEVILTGYNIADFDLPFLINRARKLHVHCPFRFLKDENGEVKVWRVAATEGTLKGEPLSYPAIVTDLPICVVDALHLVCRWDYVAKQLRSYDLKSVAAHLGVNQPDRPILSSEEIQHTFRHDFERFKAYLLADLRETYQVFRKLVPPYLAIAELTNLSLDSVVTRSTAWVWEQILKQHYGFEPEPDQKEKYGGGLVVCRQGLWSPCLKLDIASLYPRIMLAFRVHSRKDTDQVALKWLKALTEQRLELKKRAKQGDSNAQILQEAMKVLINSLYGFYGTGGYGFNDMKAAARVTELGRKVLTVMIAAIEDAGGIVVEADTDGVIVCYRNADPQQILQSVQAALPSVFKVELDWQDTICFVSDEKNYIVLTESEVKEVKGSKWRGRDKEAFLTEAIPTFLRLYVNEGEEAATNFARQVFKEIQTGKGWRWVVRCHKVGKGDKFLMDAGFKLGEIATYAYADKKRKVISTDPTRGYDTSHYSKEFSKILQEVLQIVKLGG